MADLRRTELELRAERAVLAQAASSRDWLEADVTFAELENLARTAGARVVGQLRQFRNQPDRRQFPGQIIAQLGYPPGCLRIEGVARHRRRG